MKQFLCVLLLFMSTLAVSTSYAQGSLPDTQSELVTDTNFEKLVDKYTNKLGAGLEAIAQSLKQPAEFVYSVLVKQQVVIGITFLTLLLVGIVVIGFAIRQHTIVNNYNKAKDGDVTLIIILYIMGTGLTIAGLIHIEIILTGLINPHYGALQDIGDIIKNL